MKAKRGRGQPTLQEEVCWARFFLGPSAGDTPSSDSPGHTLGSCLSLLCTGPGSVHPAASSLWPRGNFPMLFMTQIIPWIPKGSCGSSPGLSCGSQGAPPLCQWQLVPGDAEFQGPRPGVFILPSSPGLGVSLQHTQQSPLARGTWMWELENETQGLKSSSTMAAAWVPVSLPLSLVLKIRSLD